MSPFPKLGGGAKKGSLIVIVLYRIERLRPLDEDTVKKYAFSILFGKDTFLVSVRYALEQMRHHLFQGIVFCFHEAASCGIYVKSRAILPLKIMFRMPAYWNVC